MATSKKKKKKAKAPVLGVKVSSLRFINSDGIVVAKTFRLDDGTIIRLIDEEEEIVKRSVPARDDKEDVRMTSKPPTSIQFDAALMAPREQREALIGDLTERFGRDRLTWGQRMAKLMLARDVPCGRMGREEDAYGHAFRSGY